MARQVLRVVSIAAIVAVATLPRPCAGGWADALISETGHDFGPLARGVNARHAFVLTNRLSEPITILNIRASCGCTSGRADASLLPPGQRATVEALMDTRNFVGRKETTLFVSLVTAGGREGEIRLKIASTILSDIVLNPGTIDFGVVAKGQTPEKTLTVDRLGSPNWRVTRMLSACRAIDAAMTEVARNGSTVTYQLAVRLKPDAPPGLIRDEIRVLTNDPENPGIPIQLQAQIRGDLTVAPSVLGLGNVSSAGGAQGRFVLRAPRPFQIVKVDGAGDGFSLESPDEGAQALHVLMLSYKPEEGATRGDLRHTFRVLTDLPDEPAAELTATLHVDP